MAKTSDSKKTLTANEVLHLANLVRLELTEDEITLLQSQLVDTLDYVQNLNELDTSKVKETSHTLDTNNVAFEDGAAPDRTLTQEEALKNARQSKAGFFTVSKILNK